MSTPKVVKVRNREDGLGLEVSGLEHALVRRLVLVADPLVPPRVFVELVGTNVELDVAGLLEDQPGGEEWPPELTVNERRHQLGLAPLEDRDGFQLAVPPPGTS